MDRFVDGTYILSQGRWGTWLLYNILGIHDYTPLWVEFVAVLILFATAVIASAMIRTIAKDKIPNFAYIVFACFFISSPILEYCYVYQTTNIAVALSNLALMLIVYFAYKNYFNKGKFRNYIILGAIASVFIAMYESCIQTFIAWIFVLLLMHLKFEDEKIKFKEIIKCGLATALVLAVGVIVYAIIGTGVKAYLNYNGTLTSNEKYHGLIWNSENATNMTKEKIILIAKYAKVKYILLEIKYASIFTLIIGIFECLKNKRAKYIFLILGIIIPNFIFYFLLEYTLFRIFYSWSVLVAFEIMYIYVFITECVNRQKEKYEAIRFVQYIAIIVCALLCVYQTQTLSNLFYAQYQKDEEGKETAILIGNTIITECENYQNKSIVYIYEAEKSSDTNVIMWAYNAFGEKGVEITKFINYFGYNFTNASQEVYDDELYLEDYENSTKINNIIYEGEEYIYVMLDEVM